MTCPACRRAADNPHAGLYHADCRGCAARAVAGGPNYFESRKAGKLTDAYRVELDRLGLTHAEVKAAADKLSEASQCS